MRLPKARTLIPFALFALILGLVFVPPPCTPTKREFEKGAHGYRLWWGASLRSVEHGGRRVCVPNGWEALGYEEVGDGWARYASGKTGVLVRSDAFGAIPLSFEGSSYLVALRYPLSETAPKDVARYEATVRSAFERVSALFPNDAASAPHPHTVVVTADLSVGLSETDSVYPDPGADVTYLILPPEAPRSEELFVHALMHLYNRERSDLTEYQELDSSIPAEDWQEVEASWAEIALISSDERRQGRLAYLYGIHEAVREGVAGEGDEPPFDEPGAFARLHQSVAQSGNPSFLDAQYGHYVLAPLAMVALDGLLARHDADASVATLLTRLHAGEAGFFALLEETLPAEESARVRGWMNGTETVPRALVLEGAERYRR